MILSVCNTAGGAGRGEAEALSGLARVFFYAGARSLLVSHWYVWYVDSKATVALITMSFDAIKADPKIGRAEALRCAMIASSRGALDRAHSPSVAVSIKGDERQPSIVEG